MIIRHLPKFLGQSLTEICMEQSVILLLYKTSTIERWDTFYSGTLSVMIQLFGEAN